MPGREGEGAVVPWWDADDAPPKRHPVSPPVQFAGSSIRPPHVREVVILRRRVTQPDIGDVMVVRCYEQGKWTSQLQWRGARP